MIAGEDHVDVLADHSVLLAIPAFLPALLVVGVVVFIAVRDRRGDHDDERPDDAEDRDEELR
ncbi:MULTISPECIES: hypothetical protein [Nocardia]|uniref:Secreted protein with PEP-CTERM sorting signal n=1 Tax=Nocardia aurea TaxID=2144174 RepID=A0ABV3FQT8_9NOCA|nr:MULTISPECIES: hypothetical protein [Nocardia]